MNNRHKLYLFKFFWMFLVIMPVIVPFFLSVGLTMRQIFVLQSIFGLGVCAFDVPTGYLSDLWGRKKSLVLGSFVSGVGFTCLIWAKTYHALIGYELTIALAVSFVSGADVALLYDSLDSAERAHGLRSLANMQFYMMTGESVAAVLGGFLVVHSFRAVLVANAMAAWMPFLIVLTLREPRHQKLEHHDHWANVARVWRHIFASGDRVFLLTFLNLTVWGLSSFYAVWMLQDYWQKNGVPMFAFGWLWAAGNLSVGLMGKQVHRLENRLGVKPLMFTIGLLPILGYFGMGFVGGYIGVAFGLAFYLTRGINQVLLKDALNWRTPREIRATVNSVQTFCFRFGFALTGPIIGWSIDRFGISPTLVGVGVAFILLFLAALLPLVSALAPA